jgi:hypothetical protein
MNEQTQATQKPEPKLSTIDGDTSKFNLLGCCQEELFLTGKNFLIQGK